MSKLPFEVLSKQRANRGPRWATTELTWLELIATMTGAALGIVAWLVVDLTVIGGQ